MTTKSKRCDCCGKSKTDVEPKEWGQRLMLCATCRKLGKAKVAARMAARAAEGAALEAEEDPAEVEAPAETAPVTAKPAGPAPVTVEAKAAKPAVKVGRKAKAAAPKKATISGTVKELCEQGKTNAEIWAVIQPQFNMPDKHRWFPGWYRRHHARKKAAAKGAES